MWNTERLSASVHNRKAEYLFNGENLDSAGVLGVFVHESLNAKMQLHKQLGGQVVH